MGRLVQPSTADDDCSHGIGSLTKSGDFATMGLATHHPRIFGQGKEADRLMHFVVKARQLVLNRGAGAFRVARRGLGLIESHEQIAPSDRRGAQ